MQTQRYASRPGSIATETDLGTIIVTPRPLYTASFEAQVYWGDVCVAEVSALVNRSAATASAKGAARRVQKSAEKAAKAAAKREATR